MQPRSVSELAHALSDSERRELIERIQRSLSLAKKDQPTIFRTQVSADYRAQMIQQGLQELGFLQRIQLWLKRVFSGMGEADAYIDLKMADTARAIQASQLADTEARYIRPRLGENVFRLWIRASPLIPFFQHLWGSEKNMREAIQYVLQQKIPNAKKTIFDFIKADELESIYEVSESKAGLRQELLSRLNRYLDSIPAEVFSGIEDGLLPLYYLKEVCFFDFAGFFRFFQVELRGMEIQAPEFKSAAVDRCLDELEHLFYALHTAKKGVPGDHLHQELFDFYRQTKDKAEREPAQSGPGQRDAAEMFMAPPEPESPPPAAPVPDLVAVSGGQDEAAAALTKAVSENREDGLKGMRRDLREFKKEIEACLESSRLADIIRFFRMDPYYKFLAYVPSLNLRDFFYASTRMGLMEALDGEFTALRKRVVNRLVAAVLKDKRRDFENYKRLILGPGKSGLPGFRYVDSLAIVYNYMGAIFMVYVRELLRMLMKALPSRNRDSSSEITFHINGVESLYEKIKIMDMSYAPENAEGKAIARMRGNMERDLSQEKTYRIYVAQKDKEFKVLLEESVDHLRSLSETIDEVLRHPVDMFNERFQSVSGMALSGGYHNKFMEISRDMKMVQRAARYQRILEEEMP
jgi:hypothetical protein